MDAGIVGLDLAIELFHQLRGGDLPLRNGLASGGDGKRGEIGPGGHFSITFGTLKNSPSVTGAFLTASSCGKQGSKTSSRHVGSFRSPDSSESEICAIGGTFVVSSSLSRSIYSR